MADVSPSPPPGGRRILGLKPRTAMIAGAVVLAGAVGYLLWRRRQSASAASTATSSSAAGGYGVDYGGELSTIQSELESLLQAEGNEPATVGGGATSAPGGGTGGSAKPPGVGQAGEGTVPGSTGGGGGKPRPGTPTAVHATRATANAVTLSWNKAPNATSYRIRATYQGKLVGSQQTVNGTSATISGLHPDHTYTFHVAAVGPGGTSAETNGPAVKTAR